MRTIASACDSERWGHTLCTSNSAPLISKFAIIPQEFNGIRVPPSPLGFRLPYQSL
jgi:hypothetical protein